MSLLDVRQIAQGAFDEANQAIKIIPAGATEFSVELSHSDNDSVYAHSPSNASLGTATDGASVPSVIIAEASCVGFHKAQLFSKVAGALSTAAIAQIEVSPADSGDIWAVNGSPLTSGTTANDVDASAVSEFCARRIRVSLTQAPVDDDVTFYLVMI